MRAALSLLPGELREFLSFPLGVRTDGSWNRHRCSGAELCAGEQTLAQLPTPSAVQACLNAAQG